MHSENTVSLKIYLYEGRINTEVRRFEVDQSVITNYDYMRERLQVAMPKLRGKIFRLMWQDADGDEITISSDEELMIALSELNTNVCKFIVRLQSDEEDRDPVINISLPSIPDLYGLITSFSNSCPLFAELQSDISCHACQQPITGIRYRCLECVSYYQCGECEYKKTHPDHVMLRMTKSPSVASLISKCMQIFKCHLIRGSQCAGMSANTFFREKMMHCPKMGTSEKEKEKDKCGSHHRSRKFRKHGHHEKQTEEAAPECPFSPDMFGNLGNLVGTFLGMYKDAVQRQNEAETINPQPHSTPNPSTSAELSVPIQTIRLDDGPAMPASAEDTMEEDNSNGGPSTSAADTQKDAKIQMALELLAEMGFNDENHWLSRLLEHFNGDIAKTIDHLTLGK